MLTLRSSSRWTSRWIDEMVSFGDEIEARLTPTLRRDLARQLPRLYDRARRRLARKLELHGEADDVPPLPWSRCSATGGPCGTG